MSDLIGDTSYLTKTEIPFSAVLTLTGSTGSGHTPLLDIPGIKTLVGNYALVRILSGSLSCQIIGPPVADQAVSAHVAILPNLGSTSQQWPTKTAHILTIADSCLVQHSLYVPSLPVTLGFGPQVTSQIKPAPILGYPPEVCWAFTIAGGVSTTECFVRIRGLLDVQGHDYVQTW